MRRFLVLFAVVLALVAVPYVTRSTAGRRVLYAALGVVLAYLVLKLTGIIDAWVPGRSGVF